MTSLRLMSMGLEKSTDRAERTTAMGNDVVGVRGGEGVEAHERDEGVEVQVDVGR